MTETPNKNKSDISTLSESDPSTDSKISLINIETSWIGERIDKTLSQIPELGTRSRVASLIEKNNILVNDKAVKSSYLIREHDQIKIIWPEITPSELQPLNIQLDILFEDDELIVINKPSGLVVHPAAGHAQDTLVNALLAHTKNLSMKFGEERPGIVHRLDKETSGLIVVAKNDFSHENLAQQFRIRKTHRIYEAIVFGKFKNESGLIESYLARHLTDRKKYASVLNQNKKILHKSELNEGDEEVGKWAITNYKVLQQAKEFSFVQLKLETGRTHQIRVHLSELGHPIIGDIVYGSQKRNSSIKNMSLRKSIENLNRFALHAKELGFFHPRSGEWMFFKTPWSDEMKLLINQIGFLEETP